MAISSRHLVVLSGPAGEVMPPGPWNSITAVDGGGNMLHAWGTAAQLVVGDSDSITPGAAAFHEAAGAVFQRYPSDKDATDFELALTALKSTPDDEIHIVGMVGGRSDMSLGNLLILGGRTEQGLFSFDLPDGCGGVMGPGSLEIALPAGSASALLSLTSTASGIFSHGVRWPLDGETFSLHEARGVSNIVTDPPWRLRLSSGALVWFLRGIRRRDIRLSWDSAGRCSNTGSPSCP